MRVDRALKFYEEVLGLGYLHYGLWEDEPLTLEGMKAAQERYAETLCVWIPEGVERVLDAGCGTGGNARKLAARGYEVEGLSPDPYQRERFTERTGLPFHLARYQEFEPEETYDLVLMSESCQYVPLAAVFSKTKQVAPGGHLLVSDYFTLEKDGSRLTKSGHLLEAFLAAAESEGLTLERREDVTERVLPTLDLAREIAERYVEPALRLIAETVEEKRPWFYAAGKRLLRKPLRKLDEQRVLLDSAEFARLKRYEIFLFSVPEGNDGRPRSLRIFSAR